MEEMNLYSVESAELYELIDGVKVELGKENEEYRKLKNEAKEIKEMYHNIQLLFDDECVTELKKEECKALQNIINLYLKMQIYEQEKIFFLGARENYFYFRKLGILKERG